MFHDLALGADLCAAPEWMQGLWGECEQLKDDLENYLDPTATDTLGYYISEFRKHSLSYIKEGIIAYEIRLKRQYQSITKSFTAFCEKWFGKSVWQVDRTIRAADLAIRLISMGFSELPQNEAQCRPLLKLNDRDLEEVWGRVCRFIPEKDRTAKNIEAIANRCSEVDPDYMGKRASKRIEVNPDQWDLLETKAARYGMTPKQYLDLLLKKDLGDEMEEVEEMEEQAIAPQPEPEQPKKRAKGFGGNAFTKMLPNLLPNHGKTNTERLTTATDTDTPETDQSKTVCYPPFYPQGIKARNCTGDRRRSEGCELATT